MNQINDIIEEYLSDKKELSLLSVVNDVVTLKNNDGRELTMKLSTIETLVQNKKKSQERERQKQLRKKEQARLNEQRKLELKNKPVQTIMKFLEGTIYRIDEEPVYENIKNETLVHLINTETGKKFTRRYDSIKNRVRDNKKCSTDYMITTYTFDECIEYIEEHSYICPNDIERQLHNYISHKGWMNRIAEHFKWTGNKNPRCIYLYKITVNGEETYYIGLTDNLERRHREHLYDIKRKCRKTALEKVCIDNDIVPEFPEQLTTYLDYNDAPDVEKTLIASYRKNGRKVVNISKGGSLGGHLYSKKDYTYDECLEDAMQYETENDWKLKNYKIYRYTQKKHWVEEIRYYMLRNVSMDWFKKYEFDLCKRIVTEEYINKNIHITYKEFCEREPSIRNAFKRKGHEHWYSEICGDYFKKYSRDYPITKEETIEQLKTIDKIKEIPQNIKNACSYYKITPSDYIQRQRNVKPVIQKDLNGMFIAEYTSATEAAILNNIRANNISQVCTNKKKSAGGFIWEYKTA